jgi:Caspase domain
MPSRNVALLVGVGSFNDSAFRPLRFCGNDIDDLGRVLSDPNIAQFEVTKLVAPTRDEILEALDRGASELQPEDKLIFYYAGHGKRSPAGKLYLVAKDTKIDLLRATAVPIDQVLEIMQESHSSQRVMILDCCHSGAVGGEFRGEIADNLQELARARGTCILTSATGIQLAEERESGTPDGRGNGIFTRYLVEGLETGLAAGGAEFITVDNLYDYAFNRVVTNSVQTPVKWVIGGVGNIVIGKSMSGGWQGQRQVIQEEFRNLHTNRLISGAILDRVLRIASRDLGQLSPTERAFADELLKFARKDITLLDLLANKEAKPEIPTDESIARRRSDPLTAGDGLPGRRSLLDKRVISFPALGDAFRTGLRSPYMPILILVVGFATIESGLSYDLRRGLFLLMGVAGFGWAGILLLKQLQEVARNRGVSLRLIFRIFILSVALFGFGLMFTLGTLHWWY